MAEKNKYHVRTLEELDKHGRVVSTRIVNDLDAMIRDRFPKLKADYEKRIAEKEKGELLPFPK